jgi:flotillin
MLPDLLNMVTRAISDNLHIEKLTIVDSGSGSGLPQHVKGITGSAIAILEQLKNATGLDVTSLLQQAANKGNGTGFSKQFP